MKISSTTSLALAVGSALAAIAVAVGLLMSEDRNETLTETYNIDPAESCYSPDPESEYNRDNAAKQTLVMAWQITDNLGRIGAGIQRDEFSQERPICFAPGEKMESGMEGGGFLERYLVVDNQKTPSWLVSQFTEGRLDGIGNKYTDGTSRYIAADALFWNRIRHAVPETYKLYVAYKLAQAEQPGSPFATQHWTAAKSDAALIDAAAAYEEGISGSKNPYAAWQDSLKAYLTAPMALNQRDIAFLQWYAGQTGEQETNIQVEVTCDADGFSPSHYIWTTLPEGVTRDDVLTWEVRSDMASDCAYVMNQYEDEVEAARDEMEDGIDELETYISEMEDYISELENYDAAPDEESEVASELSSARSELSGARSDLSSLESDLRGLTVEDQEIDWEIPIAHNPPSDVHSLGFDPATLVSYIESVFGESGVISYEDAEAIALDDEFIRLYSEQAEGWYNMAAGNAAIYADNYNPRNNSYGAGVDPGFLSQLAVK